MKAPLDREEDYYTQGPRSFFRLHEKVTRYIARRQRSP